MRFFRPSLSPFVFSIADKPIKSIYLSDDLSTMKIACVESKTEKDKIYPSLKKEIDASSIQATVNGNKSHIQISGLYDVAIELSKTANQIKAKDPSFFAELASYEKSLESNLENNPLNLDDFVNSPLHLFYFHLQGLRRDGVQHTMEFPLKLLAANGLLPRADLNQIVLKLWLKTNAVRKQQAAVLTALPTTTNFTPYVFRMP